MKQYFGTDGVRGRANQHPMTAQMALAIGAEAPAEGFFVAPELFTDVRQDMALMQDEVFGPVITFGVVATYFFSSPNNAFISSLPAVSIPASAAIVFADWAIITGFNFSSNHMSAFKSALPLLSSRTAP